MAFFSIPNVQVEGIVACVPSTVQKVVDSGCLSKEDAEKLTATTGISERRIANETTCTSDLCYQAAIKLLNELHWKREEIDALIFVTQTPDYLLPATSPILQHKLGLSTRCFTLDISLGCSGYVYGLVTLASLMSSGSIKKGLLLVGDTISKICSTEDKSTYPLFGDAGSATALVYNPEASPINANMYSDGKGFDTILITDGGARNPFNQKSLISSEISEGISRSPNQLILNGMDVFSFGITKAPQVIKELLSHCQLTVNEVDYFVLHQANMLMNETIRRKIGVGKEKVPYTLAKFGNTSCATIPLTIAVELKDQITEKRLVLCGFGVGLSWGAVYLQTGALKYLDCIEL